MRTISRLSLGLGLAILTTGLLTVPVANTRADKDDKSGADKGQDKKAADKGGKSLEDCLKDTGLAHSRSMSQEGRVSYRVTLEGGGEVSVVVISENPPWTWKYKNGFAATPVYMWTTVAQLPKDFKPPVAMYKKIGEINNNVTLGNLSIVPDGVFYNYGFFRYNLDEETLADYLFNMHWRRLECRKAMLPFLEEAQGAK